MSFAWWLVLTASQGLLSVTGTRHGKLGAGQMFCYRQHSPQIHATGLPLDLDVCQSFNIHPRSQETCQAVGVFNAVSVQRQIGETGFVSICDRVTSCDQSTQAKTTLGSQHASIFDPNFAQLPSSTIRPKCPSIKWPCSHKLPSCRMSSASSGSNSAIVTWSQ